MNRLRNEQGSALMMAVIMLFVILGLGTALVWTAVGQKRAGSNQQNGESAYSLAEAALNAQIYALSTKWPTANDGPSSSSSSNYGYPSSCNSASNGTSYCPTPGDLSSYPSNTATCPTGTQGDSWSSSSTPETSQWTTYVRDGGTSGSAQQEVFNDATEKSALPYNSSYNSAVNASNYLWVRSVATVNCKEVVLVSQVAMQVVSVGFPKYVVVANSINAGNSGNKIILNLQDPTNLTDVDVSLRCTGLGGTGDPPSSSCDGLSSNQVAPSTMSSAYFAGATSSTTLTSSQISELKTLAEQDGTYYSGGNCPSSLTGSLVFIDGTASSPTDCSYSGNSTYNSETSPGLLVITYGSLELTGGATYFGLIYDANEQGSSSTSLVQLKGTSSVYGGVDVDGNGGVSLGDSGNGSVSCSDGGGGNGQKCGDLEYLSAAFNGLVGFGGADAAPNTFRELPVTQ